MFSYKHCISYNCICAEHSRFFINQVSPDVGYPGRNNWQHSKQLCRWFEGQMLDFFLQLFSEIHTYHPALVGAPSPSAFSLGPAPV